MDFRDFILNLLGSKWVQALVLLGTAAFCWFGLDWLSWQAFLWWNPMTSQALYILRWASTVILVIWGLVLLAGAVAD